MLSEYDAQALENREEYLSALDISGNGIMGVLDIPEIDYQNISYYADPTVKKEGPRNLEEIDPQVMKQVYELGRQIAEEQLEDLQEYLSPVKSGTL